MYLTQISASGRVCSCFLCFPILIYAIAIVAAAIVVILYLRKKRKP